MKKFIRTLVLGGVITIAVGSATFSMESWVPGFYRALESVGDFQYKPWIFFVPAICALILIAAMFPQYRNIKSVAALLLGGLFVTAIGVVAIFSLAMSGLPNMRY